MAKLVVLYVVHLSAFGSSVPDRLEALHAYDTLAECWEAAESRSSPHDGAERLYICLPARQ